MRPHVIPIMIEEDMHQPRWAYRLCLPLDLMAEVRATANRCSNPKSVCLNNILYRNYARNQNGIVID